MAELIVKYEDKIVERVVVEKQRISVGRTNDNDIVLENRGVSRRHCTIEFNEQGAIVIDNESLNGTFVNNRRVNEESLRDQDSIAVGKYTLVFHVKESEPQSDADHAFDGTMILSTKKQKEIVEGDKRDRETVRRAGGSALIGEQNTEFKDYSLDHDITTIGKAKFTHIKARGFWVSGIQAKIVREGAVYSIVNVGRKGQARLNGEAVTSSLLRNGDIIEVGNTSFRFVEDKR